VRAVAQRRSKPTSPNASFGVWPQQTQNEGAPCQKPDHLGP
jgi:hypothetical protein